MSSGCLPMPPDAAGKKPCSTRERLGRHAPPLHHGECAQSRLPRAFVATSFVTADQARPRAQSAADPNLDVGSVTYHALEREPICLTCGELRLSDTVTTLLVNRGLGHSSDMCARGFGIGAPREQRRLPACAVLRCDFQP